MSIGNLIGIIILIIIYYIVLTLLFLKLYERETSFGILNTFREILCFIPLVRFIYYIYMKI